MQQGNVIQLDATLAMSAARLSLQHRLPMADSIVYATGHALDAIVWTQDEDFDGSPDVKFFPKSRKT